MKLTANLQFDRLNSNLLSDFRLLEDLIKSYFNDPFTYMKLVAKDEILIQAIKII